jgi:serine/threonine protein kinase/WD40 repeat protein
VSNAVVPTATADWVGLTLDQRYKVVAMLGEGGMGYVLRARDTRLGCDVVLKAPRPEMLADKEFRKRFRDEVAALVKLAHPHIVKVSDYGQHEGTPFAVMQFLPGGSLDDRRPRDTEKRFKPIAAKSLSEWLAPIGDALDFIHGQGYIHRDIKPANILFDAHKHPFLSDFGVAKAMAGGQQADRKGLTGIGMVLGTPEYLAPEVVLGQPFDGRIDQYALAITIYELLTGSVPFTGPTGPAILVKQTIETAKPLHELRTTVSPALSAAIVRAMAKNPAERFATCKEFAAAVLAGVSGAAVPARGQATPPKTAAPTATGSADTPKATLTKPISMDLTGKPKSAPTKPKRSPAIIGVWIGAAVLVLGGIAGGIAMMNRSKPSKPPGVASAPDTHDSTPQVDPIVKALEKAPRATPPSGTNKSKGGPAKNNSGKANANTKAKPEVPPSSSAPTTIESLTIEPTEFPLIAGGPGKELKVTIQRTGTAPLTIQIQNSLGLKVTPPTRMFIPRMTDTSFQIYAPFGVKAGSGTLTVTVSGGEAPRSETIPVTISTQEYRIAKIEPRELDLQPGDSRDVRVTLDRSGRYGGAVQVMIEESAAVEMSNPVTIDADKTSANVRLRVKSSATSGETAFTVKTWGTQLNLIQTTTGVLRAFKPLTLVATVSSNAGPITAVAIHGSYGDVLKVLSGHEDGSIKAWYRPEPKRRPSEFKWAWTETEHKRAISALEYSADGFQALTGSGDGMVGLWDTRTKNQLIRKYNEKGDWHKRGVWCVYFQAPGQLPQQFGDAAGATLDKASPVSISDDMGILWSTTGDDDTNGPRFLSVSGRKKLAKFSVPSAESLRSPSTHIGQTLADGYELAGIGGDQLSVYKRGALLATLPKAKTPIQAMVLSGGGARALALGDGRVSLWDVSAKRAIPGFPWKPDSNVTAAAISADGTLLLTGTAEGLLQVWKLP